MKIADALSGITRLFLDTAPVIYFVERHPAYAALVDDIFDRIDRGVIQAVTSPVTLTECMVQPIRNGLTSLAQDFDDLIVAGSNVTFVPIGPDIAYHAAELRAIHNFRLADAFQAAAALAAGCGAILSNDRALKRLHSLPALILDDLEL